MQLEKRYNNFGENFNIIYMKVAAISDIHGQLIDPTLFSSDIDILCICGDISPVKYDRNIEKVKLWFAAEFKNWIKELPVKKVLIIAGNHDFYLQELFVNGIRFDIGLNDKLVYLLDESFEYEGVKFYGTPWVADLRNWAFYKNNTELEIAYRNIPEDTDILLCHMPPMIGNVGVVNQWNRRNTGSNFGSIVFANVIYQRPQLKYVFCGHVHSGSHTGVLANDSNTRIVNVSLLDEDYKLTQFKYYTIEM